MHHWKKTTSDKLNLQSYSFFDFVSAWTGVGGYMHAELARDLGFEVSDG